MLLQATQSPSSPLFSTALAINNLNKLWRQIACFHSKRLVFLSSPLDRTPLTELSSTRPSMMLHLVIPLLPHTPVQVFALTLERSLSSQVAQSPGSQKVLFIYFTHLITIYLPIDAPSSIAVRRSIESQKHNPMFAACRCIHKHHENFTHKNSEE